MSPLDTVNTDGSRTCRLDVFFLIAPRRDYVWCRHCMTKRSSRPCVFLGNVTLGQSFSKYRKVRMYISYESSFTTVTSSFSSPQPERLEQIGPVFYFRFCSIVTPFATVHGEKGEGGREKEEGRRNYKRCVWTKTGLTLYRNGTKTGVGRALHIDFPPRIQ